MTPRPRITFRAFAPAAVAASGALVLSAASSAIGLGRTSAALVVALGLGALFSILGRAFERRMSRRVHSFAVQLRDPRTQFPPVPDPSLDPIQKELLGLGADLRLREKKVSEGERLLLAVVEMTPAALLLLGEDGVVLATNEAARALFFRGEEVRDHSILELLARTRAPTSPNLLGRVLSANSDDLLVAEDAEAVPHTHHLTKRYFELEGRNVILVMVADLSREMLRKEVEVYKRVVRVLSHEVNNSLAPISSLMHSAHFLLANSSGVSGSGGRATSPAAKRLARVFDTVAGRAEHLKRFLAGYAELARLPLPKKAAVEWPAFFDRVEALYPGLAATTHRGSGAWFDPAQLEQVVVNLIKNAEEAGSPREAIAIEADVDPERGTRIVIRDRGRGMSPEVMKLALVPLFSTKDDGGGLGLSVCREIVEGHGGTLRLGARHGGGLEVVLRLPPRTQAKVRTMQTGPLTRPPEGARARNAGL